MKRKCFLLSLVMLMSALFAKADLQRVNGWYEIGNYDELQEFIMLLRNGQTGINGKLTADIDMTEVKNFMPLGYLQEGTGDFGFAGHFDGQCHVIRNMNFELAEDQTFHLGFFGHINGGTVMNLGFENARLISTYGAPVGVLAAKADNAKITNCYTMGEIVLETANERVGGLVGSANGGTTFTNCFSTASSWGIAEGEEAPKFVNTFVGEELDGIAATGKMCFLLNGDQSVIRFRQTIGTDAYPMFGESHKQVYAAGELNCDGSPKGEVTYSNTPSQIVLPPHQYDEDGYCIVCGKSNGIIAADEEGWYNITTPEELRYVSREVVNKGNSKTKIRLMNDLDMSTIPNFPPIGYFADSGAQIAFQGVFDGQNHIISNLTVTVYDEGEAGLFGRINGGGYIKNFGVVNASVSNMSGIRAGVIAGEINACTVDNVFSTGEISISTDHPQKGGISGEAAEATLNNCYTTYDVLSVGTPPRTQNNCWCGEEARQMAATGELCYKMNHETYQNPTWYQTLGEDEFPVLDSTHGLVYPAGEGEYTSAVSDEDFRIMVNTIINAEIAKYEDLVATKTLVNNYIKKLKALRGSLLEDFTKAYNSMEGLRTTIHDSESAYAAYIAKAEEVKDYLDKNQGLEGDALDLLVQYLEEDVEPSDEFPNGSCVYIMDKMALLADELTDEIAFLDALKEKAVIQGYSAGADISTLLTNGDFSDQANGWTFNSGKLAGCWNTPNATVKYIANSGTMDISQTVTGLKNGIYEVRMNSYTEFTNASSDATYNYTGFIYANGNKNYVKTQRSDLQPVEIKEKYPNDFAERSDVNGEFQGYCPGTVPGVAYAFQEGYYDNRILAKVTDGTLTLGISNGGMKNMGNAVYYGNTRLFYLGSMEDAESGMNDVLDAMVENANHVINDYNATADVYAEAPNYTVQLKKQLSDLVAQATSAGTAEEKYNLIHAMGEVFQAIYDSKCVYLEMTKTMSDFSDAYNESNCTAEESNNMQDMLDQMLDIYETGSGTNQEVLQWIDKMKQDPYYLLTYGVEPEQIDGVFQLSTPHNMVWFSYYVNNVINKVSTKAVLTNDIDMSSVQNFKPIGVHSDADGLANEFVGEFDGQGHVISNLNIEVTDSRETGLFGRALYSTIKNLGIVNAKIVNLSNVRAGVLGGEIHVSNIINCYTTGNLEVITDHPQHCGIAGECASTALYSCWTTYPELTNFASLTENCFYGEEAEAIMGTGEMAFRLNGNQSQISWYQNIGEDAYPVLDQTHSVVYMKGEVDCGGKSIGEATYTNEKQDIVLPEHQFNEDGICIVCGADGGKCAPGEDGFFHLTNAFQLRYFANYVTNTDEHANACLENDIDMSVMDNFPMIAHYSDYLPNSRVFRGEFDGKGHVIRNLKITIDDRWEGGLFSRCSEATIRNLGIENATITNTHSDGVRIGVLGGELHLTKVYNCWTCGNLQINTTHSQKGGFAGEAAGGEFYGCWTTYKNIGAMATAHNSYAGDEVAATIGTGELCYKLNAGKIVNPAWHQTLGQDAQPVLDPSHKVVYLDENGIYTNGNSQLPNQKGTQDDPFIIMNVNDMLALSGYLKADQTNFVKLGVDLNMEKVKEWEPICNDASYAIDFDGQGHIISNLTCNAASSYNSFFGVLTGNLRNIGFENMTVADNDRTGMIAARVGFADNRMESVIEHVYVNGKLTCGGAYGGGMFGKVAGYTIIKNCYANVDVNSTATYTGGIVGHVAEKLSMENVYAAGSTTRGGGIVGGGQSKDTPASVYKNVAVWNNDYEIFGRTVRGDVKQGVIFYDSTNFSEMQKAVVTWDASVWSCDMQEGSYPVLIGSANTPDGIEGIEHSTLNIENSVYDLAGRRINSQSSIPNSQLKKGIYIVGGKKILFK
jgi:hypothetical protein